MLSEGELIGRFEVAARVGAGGMGEVYRARDTRLGRDVALKVLPSELASDPERLRRFEHEARAAAALNHPNVLGLYDLGEHGGAPYLVTELLEGEDLRARITRGALPVREAVQIAVQVARGLAAAHAKCIVHRDLKPENLFLTTEGTLKILDFGLASLRSTEETASRLGEAPTESGLTQAGAVLGTAGYMAPEQVRGRRVDQRADIFAFGCILYEMLTGRRAFRGETPADTLGAILRDDPPGLETDGSDISPALAQLVRRCLEKRPEDRLSSARDLALALPAAVTEGDAGLASAVAAQPRKRPALVLALVATLAMAGALGVALWLRGDLFGGSPEVTLEPARVMVAPFANATGDASLDPVTTRVADAITRGIVELRDVEAVPAPRDVAAGDEAALCAAARAAGAGVLASGSVYLSGDTIELRGTLIDAAKGKPIFALTPERGPRGQPEEAIDHVRQRAMTGVNMHLREYPVLEGMRRPPLYSAVQEWVTARDLMNAEADLPVWRRHLEKASELDPGFWLPQVYLTWSYYGTGENDKLEEVKRRLHANEDRMDEAERLFMQYSEARFEGRPLEELRLARALLTLAPENVQAYGWYAANAAARLNRPREALQDLGDLETFDWDAQGMGTSKRGTLLVATAAAAYHLLGEHEAELEVVRFGLDRYPDSLYLRLKQVKALAALGRVPEVEEVITEVVHAASQGIKGRDVVIGACMELRAHGHPEDARRIASKAADRYAKEPRQEPEPVNDVLAHVQYLSLAERWQEARDLARRTYEAHPDDLDAQASWGIAAARAGDREVAETIAQTLATRDPGSHSPEWVPLWSRAAIAAQLGEKERVMELLRQALGRGAWYIELHVDHNLEPLHGYPPFEELVKPKG
jgi:tetratricopeptide (TPR) repeat protein/TolB-like protein